MIGFKMFTRFKLLLLPLIPLAYYLFLKGQALSEAVSVIRGSAAILSSTEGGGQYTGLASSLLGEANFWYSVYRLAFILIGLLIILVLLLPLEFSAVRHGTGGKQIETKSYDGIREIGNDGYRAYLAKKYIEYIDVLKKYSVRGAMHDDIEEALINAHNLEITPVQLSIDASRARWDPLVKHYELYVNGVSKGNVKPGSRLLLSIDSGNSKVEIIMILKFGLRAAQVTTGEFELASGANIEFLLERQGFNEWVVKK